ncbi:MAG: flippase-like domain-containing protein [Clostridiales bacterium]|nr:flippase-like domain-containing protein [Clostridiales bacterium]
MRAYIMTMKNKKKWFNIRFASETIKRTKLWQNITDVFDKNNRIFFAISHKIKPETLIEEKLEISKEETAPTTQKAKKKKVFNLVFFLINLVLVALVFWNFAREQGGIQPLSTLFANSPRWGYIFIAIGLFFLTNLFNATKFAVFIFSKTRKIRPWFSYKLAVFGRYYDLITPMGSGGQPFEIYYLKKNGYSGEASTAIPLAKYMIWQVAFSILCTTILIMYSKNLVSTPAVLILAWVGLSIILLLFLFVFFMSITKRFGAVLVVGVLKILVKCKIIKNYRKTLKKVLKFVKSYQYSIKHFAKSPRTVIASILATMGSLISNALIAYFVLKSFIDTPSMSCYDIVCYCLICECAVAIIPLPGGSGASELSFNALLGSLFPVGTLFWGVLFWRFLVYYAYIPQGWIIMLIDAINKDKKPKTKIKELNFVPKQEESTKNSIEIKTK